jgi:hypothetical protein
VVCLPSGNKLSHEQNVLPFVITNGGYQWKLDLFTELTKNMISTPCSKKKLEWDAHNMLRLSSTNNALLSSDDDIFSSFPLCEIFKL